MLVQFWLHNFGSNVVTFGVHVGDRLVGTAKRIQIEWSKQPDMWCFKDTQICIQWRTLGNFPRSLYSLNWDFLLSQINRWTTTTWSNVWVVLPKPSWYEFLIGFLIWTPTSNYLHLTTFSNICLILSIFLYM